MGGSRRSIWQQAGAANPARALFPATSPVDVQPAGNALYGPRGAGLERVDVLGDRRGHYAHDVRLGTGGPQTTVLPRLLVGHGQSPGGPSDP